MSALTPERATMTVGDRVEIHEIRMFGADSWRPATVIRVDGERFAAQLVKGDFGEPGMDRKWFRMHDRGSHWR